MDIFALFQQMLILLLILLTGFVAAKKKILDDKSNTVMSALICFLTNPAQVIASSLSGAHPLSNGNVLLLTGISVLIFAFLIAVSFPVVKLLFPQSADENRVFRYMLIFSNCGYMGYPVIEALFGKEYSFYVTVFVLVFQLVCWSYGVSLMSGEKLKITRKVLTRPLIVSALISFVLYFLDVRPLWDAAPKVMTVVYGAFDTLGKMTTVLAMLIIGVSLAGLSLKEAFGQWRIYLLSAIKLIALPLIGWLILRNFPIDESIHGFCVVILAMPVATSATITSYQYGGNIKLASAGVFVTTILSLFTVPLLMMLLFA